MAIDLRRGWGATALATALAVGMLNWGPLGMFFLVPLIWLHRRRGLAYFLVAATATLVGVAASQVVLLSLSKSSWSIMQGLRLGFAGILTLGWVAIVLLERLGWRFLVRLLVVTATTGILIFVFIGQVSEFGQKLEQVLNESWAQSQQLSGLNAADMISPAEKKVLFSLIEQAFLACFLVPFFFFWGITGWMGRVVASQNLSNVWKDFSVPTWGVWVFLGLWIAILLRLVLSRPGINADLGAVEYGVFNAALIALVVHALRGWGILQILMDRWGFPRLLQLALGVGLMVLALWPSSGQLLVIVGLPILAVLELWVNFRKREQGVRE